MSTNIEWTDETWNPIRGCSRISDGCRNCYAERQAIRQINGAYAGLIKRTSQGPAWTGELRMTSEALDIPLRWRKPRRIFVNSMSDLFHEKASSSFTERVFDVMRLCPQHTFQILTKRPQRMQEWVSWIGRLWARHPIPGLTWPLPNVHLIVSVENQQTAGERIPLLLQTQAAVRGVSYEPALGPVTFDPLWLRASPSAAFQAGRVTPGMPAWTRIGACAIDWLIVGGESGPGARPCDIAWIRSAVEQCRAANVPTFVKQLGAYSYEPLRFFEPGNQPLRLKFSDRKGGDPAEWPEDLRVREFPR